jgi:hypothetical protein
MRTRISFFCCLLIIATFSIVHVEAQPLNLQASWQLVSTMHAPQARYGHGMVYDSLRHVAVLFGGDSTGESRLNDTWEYDGTDWQLINTPQSPSGRVNLQSSMVYDTIRNRVVLFGGLTVSGYVNDTWEYDGSNWELVPIAQSPEPRDAQSMAYDTKRHVVVLFGGHREGVDAMNDTWEYDGVSWQQKSPEQAPPARWYSPMVYDEKRGVMVLIGGRSTFSTVLNDTWEYDGVNWRQVNVPQSPSPRDSHMLAYDTDTGETVLFGGLRDRDTRFSDTWSYDGTTWQSVSTNQTPTSSSVSSMAYDSQRQKFVFFGGGYWLTSQSQPTLFGDTWELSATPEPSLSISHIEVTQAIQDPANNVPLIAGKPTFVRVYLNCSGSCNNVTGELRGYGLGGELEGSPLSPINLSINAVSESDWKHQRGDLRRTLNFTLPSTWAYRAIAITVQIANIQSPPMPLLFNSARPLNIFYLPIRDNSQEPDRADIERAALFAGKLYPTSRLNYIPLPTWTWHRAFQCRKVGGWDSSCLIADLKTQLTERYRYLLDITGTTYIFGWLPSSSGSDLGVQGSSDPSWPNSSPGSGRAAFGVSIINSTANPRTLAHEVGHLLNRRHTNVLANQTDPNCLHSDNVDLQSDWVMHGFTDSFIHEWGTDGYGFGWLVSSSRALKNPETTYDYMSYCGQLGGFLVTENSWTSDWTYTRIFTETLKSTRMETVQVPSTPQPYFLASGLIYTDTTTVLNPIWILTSTAVLDSPPLGSLYCFEAQDAEEVSLAGRCFDADFVDYETGTPVDVVGFNIALPYTDKVNRFVLKQGTQEIGVRQVSDHAPVVNIFSPQSGDSWSPTGTYTITWSATDEDSDAITYNILYSTDGIGWVLVGSAITDTELAVNAGDLAGSNTARIRVLASDGANMTSADSPVFTVGRKSPSAIIFSPEGDGTIPLNAPLLLMGYAYDPEDSLLSESALRWTSSQDGDLGLGSQILVNLSYGQHMITLTATDSDGNIATASINVFVGNLLTFPLMSR